MSTTPLPSPFLKHMRNGFEFDLYTAEQVQQARADLGAENARLREALADITPTFAALCLKHLPRYTEQLPLIEKANAALKGTP